MSTIVIKVGGEIVKSSALRVVAAEVAAAAGRGDRVIMVHGGGPQLSAMQKTLGLTPNIVAGRRVTDEATLEVMKMVVGGQLNIDLCAALVAAGARPVGLHGASSLAIQGVRRPPRRVAGAGDQLVDFGLVGDIVGINRGLLELLLGAGHTPVLSCLPATAEGTMLNTNADVIANHVAKSMDADHLILITSTPGVLRDIEDPGSRIERLTIAQARAALQDGTVSGGMIPKLEESIEVLDSGKVGSVHIVGELSPGDLIREIDRPGSVGTAFVPG
jgi:acetylglutamate kinase